MQHASVLRAHTWPHTHHTTTQMRCCKGAVTGRNSDFLPFGAVWSCLKCHKMMDIVSRISSFSKDFQAFLSTANHFNVDCLIWKIKTILIYPIVGIEVSITYSHSWDAKIFFIYMRVLGRSKLAQLAEVLKEDVRSLKGTAPAVEKMKYNLC